MFSAHTWTCFCNLHILCRTLTALSGAELLAAVVWVPMFQGILKIVTKHSQHFRSVPFLNRPQIYRLKLYLNILTLYTVILSRHEDFNVFIINYNSSCDRMYIYINYYYLHTVNEWLLTQHNIAVIILNEVLHTFKKKYYNVISSIL